ncbi:ACT domain-containing protein, partial [Dysosmobacter welbionis]
HGIVVGAALVRQRRFDGSFGLFRQSLRLIQHFSYRIHGSRISGQFFLHIEEKGQPRFLGKVEYLLAGCICKINAFTVQLHRDASSLVFQM